MTVLELIDELSKQEPHRKVAWYNEAYRAYADVQECLHVKSKTETSLEPEDLVVLY